MRHNASQALYFPLLLLWTPFIAILLLNTPQYRDKKKICKKRYLWLETCLKAFFPSSPSPAPVDSTHSCSLQFNKPQYKKYNHRSEKRKKQHTWGSRRVMSRAPIKCNKKKNPIEGGSQPVVVVAVWLSWWLWLSSSSSSWIKEVGCYGDRYTCL